MQIPWLQNISRFQAPVAVPSMTGIHSCSLLFWDQVLLNRLAQLSSVMKVLVAACLKCE